MPLINRKTTIFKKKHWSNTLGKKIWINKQSGKGGMCLLATLQSVLEYNNIRISQEELAEKAGFVYNKGTPRNQFSKVLNQYLKKYNFIYKDICIKKSFESPEQMKKLEEIVQLSLLTGNPVGFCVSGIVPYAKGSKESAINKQRKVELQDHSMLIYDIKKNEDANETKYYVLDSLTTKKTIIKGKDLSETGVNNNSMISFAINKDIEKSFFKDINWEKWLNNNYSFDEKIIEKIDTIMREYNNKNNSEIKGVYKKLPDYEKIIKNIEIKNNEKAELKIINEHEKYLLEVKGEEKYKNDIINNSKEKNINHIFKNAKIDYNSICKNNVKESISKIEELFPKIEITKKQKTNILSDIEKNMQEVNDNERE